MIKQQYGVLGDGWQKSKTKHTDETGSEVFLYH